VSLVFFFVRHRFLQGAEPSVTGPLDREYRFLPLGCEHLMLEESMYVEHRFFDFNNLCPALGLADAGICLDFRMCISTWHV
jgi:hypothetical protein